jgi:uncharacterized SAM-dependent methyltransferase
LLNKETFISVLNEIFEQIATIPGYVPTFQTEAALAKN